MPRKHEHTNFDASFGITSTTNSQVERDLEEALDILEKFINEVGNPRAEKFVDRFEHSPLKKSNQPSPLQFEPSSSTELLTMESKPDKL